jgi:hypothetical protein
MLASRVSGSRSAGGRGAKTVRTGGVTRHKSLSTTEHYVHFLKADLEDAARRLNEPDAFPDPGGRGKSGETALRAS